MTPQPDTYWPENELAFIRVCFPDVLTHIRTWWILRLWLGILPQVAARKTMHTRLILAFPPLGLFKDVTWLSYNFLKPFGVTVW